MIHWSYVVAILLGLWSGYYWYRSLFKRNADIGDFFYALMLTVAGLSWLVGTLVL